jgi:membrane protease YdiL (CAAX protease family)
MGRRLNAVLEIAAVFIFLQLAGMLIFALLRDYQPFTIFGHGAYTAIAYSFIALAVVTLTIVAKRDFSEYGISLRSLGSDIKVVALCVIPVNAALLLGLCLPMPHIEGVGLVLLNLIIGLAMLLVVVKLLSKLPYKEDRVYRGNKVMIGALVFVPAMLLLSTSDIAPGLPWLLYDFFMYFVFVGPVEELVYRGYMQSRLNDAFGRPYRLFGVSWGIGLLAMALFFGLGHVFNYRFNPFLGNYAMDWTWGLGVMAFGLTMGFVREKTGNIVAPAMLHAVVDFAPSLSRFVFDF